MSSVILHKAITGVNLVKHVITHLSFEAALLHTEHMDIQISRKKERKENKV